MSKSSLYQSYKKISRGLFDPIVSDPKLPASYYKNLSSRFENCAKKRKQYRDSYVPPQLHDEGHQKAIEQAEQQSEEARKIFLEKNSNDLRHLMAIVEDSISDENRFECLPVKSPRPRKRTIPEPIRPPSPRPLKPVIVNADSQSALPQFRKTDPIVKKLETVSELVTIMSKFWQNEYQKDIPIINEASYFRLRMVTWFALRHVPLTQLDYAKRLRDPKSLSIISQICRNKSLVKILETEWHKCLHSTLIGMVNSMGLAGIVKRNQIIKEMKNPKGRYGKSGRVYLFTAILKTLILLKTEWATLYGV